MLASIEDVPPLDRARAKDAQAIVVLGFGSYFAAPEYGGDTVGSGSLLRLRYAARLQRETGLPLLVTGGAPLGGVAEGRSMQAALEREFGVKVRWVEDASADTRGNARLSAPLLREAGVKRVLLVTHAWHMRRALAEFSAAGLEAIPAPTGYESTGPLTALDFLPGPGGLWAGRIALHERLGGFVQRLGN
ncbi:MAG: YdcF family protein, partial [Rhodocyclaceae bacterium]|nr:YdcF family protein [Rhodocyclaceae bacterium]